MWVLHECLERVAEDLDSTKTLLKYGLHGTNLSVLVAMGDTDHPFVKDESEENEEEARDERENETRLLRRIDFNRYVCTWLLIQSNYRIRKWSLIQSNYKIRKWPLIQCYYRRNLN